MIIEVEALKMMILDNVKIELGTSRDIVVNLLGSGAEFQNQIFYFNNELKIVFDDANHVEFIEFLGGIDGNLQPTIYGKSVFRTDANELIDMLKCKNNGLVLDNENGYSYSFAEISVGVYRESTPKAVEETIAEAISFGNPLTKEEIEYEMFRANHFATFGFGVKGYYL